MIYRLSLLALLATSPAAAGETEFPIYKAVVIYTTSADAPEEREVFGSFKTLESCLIPHS